MTVWIVLRYRQIDQVFLKYQDALRYVGRKGLGRFFYDIEEYHARQ